MKVMSKVSDWQSVSGAYDSFDYGWWLYLYRLENPYTFQTV